MTDSLIGNIIIYAAIFITLYVNTIWILVFRENKRAIHRAKLTKNYPRVCVIVPCYNEEKTIAQTVESLLNLDYPKDKLEIMIVDDGSKDKTFQRAQKLLRHKQVKLFRKPNGGKWTALNYGIARTNAEFVGCLDADSFVASNALKIVMAHFTDPNIMAVTSSLKVYQPKNLLQRIQKVEYILAAWHRKILSLVNSIIATPGPFSIYRRKVFEDLSPFVHGHNVEDCEIAFRMQMHNYRIANAVQSCVYTVTPSSLGKLQKQRKRWYQGYLRNAWDYKHLFFNKKYGDLGLFILPIAPLAVFSFMAMLIYTILLAVDHIHNHFIAWQVVGFNAWHIAFEPNWFFMHTAPTLFIGLTILTLTLVMYSFGEKLSSEPSEIKYAQNNTLFQRAADFLLFIFFYGLLYFIWWVGALQTVILNKKPQW